MNDRQTLLEIAVSDAYKNSSIIKHLKLFIKNNAKI